LPAFEAFLQDLDQRKPDAVYCLGDLIGYNIWPNEIIEEIRRRGIATLVGNHDLKVKYMVTFKHHISEAGKKYAYHLVSPGNREYLGTLPAHIRLEYKLNDNQPINVVLAHGSVRSVDEYVLEDTDENYLLEMMLEAGADILCVGHSHKPYHRIIGSKHVINIGSVGKPKDGNPDGCYVMLTLTDNSCLNDEGSIGIEFILFKYDIEKAAKAIQDSPLPNELADRLRKAF
jgi:predicted phosphodiesterase